MKKDFYQCNHDRIVDYFKQGIKPCRALGFELEHFLLHKTSMKPVLYDEEGGVRDILHSLLDVYDCALYDGTDIIGLQRPNTSISLEPAAQLEVALGPCYSVKEIEDLYQHFYGDLVRILGKKDIVVEAKGYHPHMRAKDMNIIPKYRYECMTQFLQQQSYSAICMMRGTASLQISIDYSSEQDAIRKMRIAEALSPLFALLCDNSLVFEGEIYKKHMARMHVWTTMRQDRVGILPGLYKDSYGFDDYAHYIMQQEAILIPDKEQGNGWKYVAEKQFADIYSHFLMEKDEIEHALSMVWPDVRLKNFIEIRPADSMPIPYALSFACLIKGLFYSEQSLSKLENYLSNLNDEDVLSAKEELQDKGYDATVYGRNAGEWIDLLFDIVQSENARNQLSCDERDYLLPLRQLARKRITLKDEDELS